MRKIPAVRRRRGERVKSTEATFKIGPMNGGEEGESGLTAEDVGLRRQTPDKGILSSQPRRRLKTAGRAGLRRFHPARINRASRCEAAARAVGVIFASNSVDSSERKLRSIRAWDYLEPPVNRECMSE